MRRLAALLLSIGLLGIVPVATVSAVECSTSLIGYATLHVDSGSNTGEGVARVWLGGVRETVTFDSVLTEPGEVTQTWYFDAGTVTLYEHASPAPIGSNFVSINSPVDVDPDDGTGSLYFSGAYNLNTDTARYLVTGTLCIGAV